MYRAKYNSPMVKQEKLELAKETKAVLTQRSVGEQSQKNQSALSLSSFKTIRESISNREWTKGKIRWTYRIQAKILLNLDRYIRSNLDKITDYSDRTASSDISGQTTVLEYKRALFYDYLLWIYPKLSMRLKEDQIAADLAQFFANTSDHFCEEGRIAISVLCSVRRRHTGDTPPVDLFLATKAIHKLYGEVKSRKKLRSFDKLLSSNELAILTSNRILFKVLLKFISILNNADEIYIKLANLCPDYREYIVRYAISTDTVKNDETKINILLLGQKFKKAARKLIFSSLVSGDKVNLEKLKLYLPKLYGSHGSSLQSRSNLSYTIIRKSLDAVVSDKNEIDEKNFRLFLGILSAAQYNILPKDMDSIINGAKFTVLLKNNLYRKRLFDAVLIPFSYNIYWMYIDVLDKEERATYLESCDDLEERMVMLESLIETGITLNVKSPVVRICVDLYEQYLENERRENIEDDDSLANTLTVHQIKSFKNLLHSDDYCYFFVNYPHELGMLGVSFIDEKQFREIIEFAHRALKGDKLCNCLLHLYTAYRKEGEKSILRDYRSTTYRAILLNLAFSAARTTSSRSLQMNVIGHMQRELEYAQDIYIDYSTSLLSLSLFSDLCKISLYSYHAYPLDIQTKPRVKEWELTDDGDLIIIPSHIHVTNSLRVSTSVKAFETKIVRGFIDTYREIDEYIKRISAIDARSINLLSSKEGPVVNYLDSSKISDQAALDYVADSQKNMSKTVKKIMVEIDKIACRNEHLPIDIIELRSFVNYYFQVVDRFEISEAIRLRVSGEKTEFTDATRELIDIAAVNFDTIFDQVKQTYSDSYSNFGNEPYHTFLKGVFLPSILNEVYKDAKLLEDRSLDQLIRWTGTTTHSDALCSVIELVTSTYNSSILNSYIFRKCVEFYTKSLAKQICHINLHQENADTIRAFNKNLIQSMLTLKKAIITSFKSMNVATDRDPYWWTVTSKDGFTSITIEVLLFMQNIVMLKPVDREEPDEAISTCTDRSDSDVLINIIRKTTVQLACSRHYRLYENLHLAARNLLIKIMPNASYLLERVASIDEKVAHVLEGSSSDHIESDDITKCLNVPKNLTAKKKTKDPLGASNKTIKKTNKKVNLGR